MAPLLGYYKAEPTEYVLCYANGRRTQAGVGLAFFYWAPITSVVSLSVSTVDVPFILNETTGNFQAITVQGQLTYRLAQPETTAQMLNFAINPRTRKYTSTDPEKLPLRLTNLIQTHLRPELARYSLEEALRRGAEMAAATLGKVQADPALKALGAECLSLFFSAVRPTPEMAKALEAEYREGLQQRADQAIYARRAAAVEQERRIKENELQTQLALEQRRQELVDLQGQNAIKQAEYDAQANAQWLAPWQATDPRLVLALAFKALGENAGKIGNLTITPEILASLLGPR